MCPFHCVPVSAMCQFGYLSWLQDHELDTWHLLGAENQACEREYVAVWLDIFNPGLTMPRESGLIGRAKFNRQLNLHHLLPDPFAAIPVSVFLSVFIPHPLRRDSRTRLYGIYSASIIASRAA